MKRIFSYLRRHWFSSFMIAWGLFLLLGSEHSYLKIQRLKSEQRDVRRQIEEYKEKTAQYQISLGELDDNDDSKLEEYARVKMGMKKANEDVFIFE